MSESLVTGGPQLLRPEDGALVEWFGSLMTIKVSADATAGSHSVVDVLEPPGAASPIHVHVEDETFCVLEGEYTVRCGDMEAVAGPGTIARLPRGIPHSHQVTGTTNARALMIFAPAASSSTSWRPAPPPPAANSRRRPLPTLPG